MNKVFTPVLLPTDGGAKLFLNKSDGVLMGPTQRFEPKLSNMVIPQHIYIPSNEQGELNDWVYCDVDREVYFVNEYNEKTGLARDKGHYPFVLDGCKKIVATTDPKVFSLVVRNGPADISFEDLKKLVELYIVDEGVFPEVRIQYELGKDISHGFLNAKDVNIITLKNTHIVFNWNSKEPEITSLETMINWIEGYRKQNGGDYPDGECVVAQLKMQLDELKMNEKY
jgi:hypothetical protein